MAVRPFKSLVHHVRRLAHAAPGAHISDAKLIQRFVADRDEAAFEVLVWRHGAMVFGLCRRLLKHEQDAEDAFQATFLTLARKARSISKGQALASWLYKVAFRIALASRGVARRTHVECLAMDLPAPADVDELAWRETQKLLDDEVNRLPEKYRAAFVLCHLEGKTNEEAAQQLGCPRGTILSRLGRARERLRLRLSRRGVTLSAATLCSFASAAPLAANLVAKSTEAVAGLVRGQSTAVVASVKVAALTEGVVYAMFLKKVKIAVACLALFAACGLAGGLVSSWAQASDGDTPQPTIAAGSEQRPEAPQAIAGEGAVDPRKAALLRTSSQNNLKMIALALHSYHDINSHFPAPATYAKSGELLLSWRVAILPYLDHENLYRQFRQNEPWDSAHNKKLLDETPMPAVFALGDKTNKTYYQMIVGKDAVFEARKKTRIIDVHDGTSNTLGIVEAARAVPWTKPEDLPYVPDQALPALGGIFGGDFNACLMDGSVRLFSKNIPEATLRALITRGGAEVIDFNKLPPAGSTMSHATPNELRHLNQRLLYDLRAAEEDIRAARSEKWLRLKDLHDLGGDRQDAPLQDLLNENRFLLDAIERSKAELEGLRRERARLDALLREMKSK